MSGVSEILTPKPFTARRVCSVHPPPLVRGEDTLAGWRGVGGSIVTSEDARHCFVLYICTLCSNASGGGREGVSQFSAQLAH
jgi:hypothetical protein